MVLCGSAVAAAQPAFPLHTAGTYIVDSNGNRVRLNAVNWFGAESPDFVVGGLDRNSLQNIVQLIKNQGFNAVRLPWSNQLYESKPVVGSYALTANPDMVGKDALTLLDQVVSALTNAGIMVILDNHNSDAEWCCNDNDGNALWYNSTYPETSWIADWQTMVQRYQSNPWVIGADLRNETRGTANWGGSPATDWHAAAERGGNAILSINPNLLIFVEGTRGGQDLSGASSLPVHLNVANRLVYSPHDYGFNYSGLTGYNDWLNRITPRWGFLITGTNPQPVWIGEFGTCNTSNNCVSSSNSNDTGFWFDFFTAYLQQYNLDWSYWALNGTQSTGRGRTFGDIESYGVLNTSWNGSAFAALSSRLDTMIAAHPNFTLTSPGSVVIFVPGHSVSPTVVITPQNGFTGAVSLSCSVSGGPSNAGYSPTCSVPSSANVTGTSAVSATVLIATTGSGSVASLRPRSLMKFWSAAGGTLACVLLIAIPARRRKGIFVFPIMMLFALPFSSCGGRATSAGNYTVTVTGTASAVTAVTTQISVNVQ